MKNEQEIRDLLEQVHKLNSFNVDQGKDDAETFGVLRALEWVLEKRQFSRTNEKTGRVEIDYSADGFMSYLTADHLEYETET
jgi:hypothetical protein